MVKYLLFYYGVVAVAASLTSKQEVQVYYFKKPSKSKIDYKDYKVDIFAISSHSFSEKVLFKLFLFLDQLVTKYQLLKLFTYFFVVAQI